MYKEVRLVRTDSNMYMKKYKSITISIKLCPRDYFIEEDSHLCAIGVRTEPGTNHNAHNIYEARLYFSDKETLKIAMVDLKMIGVQVVIKCGLTRIVVFEKENARLLYYYIKGIGVSAQGIFRTLN